ncbi:Exodeoxyribonuclease VII small subunit [hydrothermal vent metagenome]|uniref:Exodeoxyribonuclease VII small subunit n=1 Tax=hydrothermal vent metagenome TaxID=652676 RepID=A0A1W1BTF2_9ZZZZ
MSEEKSVSFEAKIEHAKQILQKLMDPEITLAESVKAYEDGIKELNEATKLLEEAKLKINEIKC